MISAEHNVLQGVRGECFLKAMGRAYLPLYIKSEYFNPIIVLSFHGLLPGIELLPFVDVLAAGIASPAYK